MENCFVYSKIMNVVKSTKEDFTLTNDQKLLKSIKKEVGDIIEFKLCTNIKNTIEIAGKSKITLTNLEGVIPNCNYTAKITDNYELYITTDCKKTTPLRYLKSETLETTYVITKKLKNTNRAITFVNNRWLTLESKNFTEELQGSLVKLTLTANEKKGNIAITPIRLLEKEEIASFSLAVRKYLELDDISTVDLLKSLISYGILYDGIIENSELINAKNLINTLFMLSKKEKDELLEYVKVSNFYAKPTAEDIKKLLISPAHISMTELVLTKFLNTEEMNLAYKELEIN